MSGGLKYLSFKQYYFDYGFSCVSKLNYVSKYMKACLENYNIQYLLSKLHFKFRFNSLSDCDSFTHVTKYWLT